MQLRLISTESNSHLILHLTLVWPCLSFITEKCTDYLSTEIFCLPYLVQQPDPNQPKPEGQHMSPLEGDPLGGVNTWPPSLPAALHRWGTTQPKSPCLTALDNAGKPVYTLTYGRNQAVDEWLPIHTGDTKPCLLLSCNLSLSLYK